MPMEQLGKTLKTISLKMIDTMVALFSQSLKRKPKYRLEPDHYGTYTLEVWDSSIGMYTCAATSVTPEAADRKIELLERDVLYYREGDKDAE